MPNIHRVSEQCRDYVTRSLVPALVLENRLRTSSPDHAGPLSMRFHTEWRHSDCPVNRWYNQRTTPTQLVSIQHWRDRKVPYRHEYLLMGLADGAVCRLERVGEGSRAAAIGREGCTAHDIIQHFPAEAYRNTLLATEPADLIVELHAESFDLLDVLAICYAVQQCRRSAAYTVQRFNSHFLCTTVLAILARRIAKWEERITEDNWGSMVGRMIDNLRDASADAHDFFGLAISAFINTDQPTPRRFVLNSIQTRLGATGHQCLRKKIAETLWGKDLKQAAHDALSDYMDDVVNHALDDSDPCATRIKQLLGAKKEISPSEDLRLSQFRREVATQQTAILLSSMQGCAASVMTSHVMQVTENAVPWMTLLRSSLHTSSFSLRALRHFGELWEDLMSPCNYIVKGRVTLRALPKVIKMNHIHNIKTFMKEGPCNPVATHVDNSTRNQSMDSVISATYTMIQQHEAADDYGVRVLVVANSWLNKKIWARCLAVCVGREIGEEVRNVSTLAQLTIVQASQPEARRQTSVFEFYEDIQRRIQAHAGEIEALGLATAILVQNDIEEAISEVWRLLPPGFRDGVDDDDQVPPYQPDPMEPANAV